MIKTFTKPSATTSGLYSGGGKLAVLTSHSFSFDLEHAHKGHNFHFIDKIIVSSLLFFVCIDLKFF